MALAKQGYPVNTGLLQRSAKLVRIEIDAYIGNLRGGVKIEVYLAESVGNKLSG